MPSTCTVTARRDLATRDLPPPPTCRLCTSNTGYPICFVHVLITVSTGRPLASPRHSHRSSADTADKKNVRKSLSDKVASLLNKVASLLNKVASLLNKVASLLKKVESLMVSSQKSLAEILISQNVAFFCACG